MTSSTRTAKNYARFTATLWTTPKVVHQWRLTQYRNQEPIINQTGTRLRRSIWMNRPTSIKVRRPLDGSSEPLTYLMFKYTTLRRADNGSIFATTHLNPTWTTSLRHSVSGIARMTLWN